MTDVTIPADVAKELAEFLMRKGLGRQHHLVLLLDPPAPSLRDEVLAVVRDADPYLPLTVADDMLAVVRRHIEALPQTVTVVDAVAGITHRGLDRDDVLRLFGGAE